MPCFTVSPPGANMLARIDNISQLRRMFVRSLVATDINPGSTPRIAIKATRTALTEYVRDHFGRVWAEIHHLTPALHSDHRAIPFDRVVVITTRPTEPVPRSVYY